MNAMFFYFDSIIFNVKIAKTHIILAQNFRVNDAVFLSKYFRYSDLIFLFVTSKIAETHNTLAQNFGEIKMWI
jgi:hypothetical protein